MSSLALFPELASEPAPEPDSASDLASAPNPEPDLAPEPAAVSAPEPVGEPVAAPQPAPRPAAELGAGAFFRVEGALVGAPSVAAAAWFAAQSQVMSARVTRLGNVAAAAALRMSGALGDSHAAQRLTWMALRDMGEDRLRVLGAEFFERYVEPRVLARGQGLLEEARRRGHRVVLLSEHLDVVVAPLGALLGADEVVCNRLELRNGRATGRLLDPVVGALSGQWVRSYCAAHGLNPERSLAYGSAGADALLLGAVGLPCAVRPDRRLRALAQDHGWPVVEG